jgi:hypothetical protein
MLTLNVISLFLVVTGSLQLTYRMLIFNISILQHTCWFLRFAFQGTVYNYLAVPFGLALAPLMFGGGSSIPVEAVLASLRIRGLRVSA